MKGIDGLYTAISAIISQFEDANHLAIDVKDIIDRIPEEVDIYSASRDWFVQFALRAAAEVGLYSRGYRSVVKGKGLFVNADNCNKPSYLAHLFNNAKVTEEQKKKVVDLITKAIKRSGCEGQMSFDFETGRFVDDITEEELIEMLRRDAKAEEKTS